MYPWGMGLTLQEDGTKRADPYDLIGVVKNVATGRYHMMIWLEAPLPSVGWADDKTDGPIRLKSRFHDTGGSETFEEALEVIRKTREWLIIDDVCVWDKPEQCLQMNFAEGYANVLCLGNWRRTKTRIGVNSSP